MDPYNADDSREEEEVNDEDNSLQGDASPTIVLPNRKDYYPKGLPWMPKITERDAELFNKPSCSKLRLHSRQCKEHSGGGCPDQSMKALTLSNSTSTPGLFAEPKAQMKEAHLALL